MSIELDLSNLGGIPKIIHLSWKQKDILKNQSPIVLNGLANLKRINPDYKLEISDDQDIEDYLKNKLHKWDYFKIKNKKIVEKVDLWRLLKIYDEGGIYVDIDRYCNVGFGKIIKDSTKCILPTCGDIDFSQDIMISCKNNPIFQKAIEYNLNRRYLFNPRGVFHLGPPLYMEAITKVVFGKGKKRKPGIEVREKYRRLLEGSKYFQTYKENLPNDSLIFKFDSETFQKGNGMTKEQFYESQNVKAWSSGFDKNTLILVSTLCAMAFIIYIASIILNQ